MEDACGTLMRATCGNAESPSRDGCVDGSKQPGREGVPRCLGGGLRAPLVYFIVFCPLCSSEMCSSSTQSFPLLKTRLLLTFMNLEPMWKLPQGAPSGSCMYVCQHAVHTHHIHTRAHTCTHTRASSRSCLRVLLIVQVHDN